MANSLNEDLTGRYVVLREDRMAAGYTELKHRVVLVKGGFGASPFTSGTMIVVEGVDGEGFSMRGYDVERFATDEEIAAVAGKPEPEPAEPPLHGDALATVEVEYLCVSVDEVEQRWTVVGVWLDGTPVVTGVVAGEHQVSGGDGMYFPDGLWATHVDAVSADAAEGLAADEMEKTRS